MADRVLGLITARGGSKGIPGKNIKPLAGKPLIAWTIEAARASKHLTRIIVSTDSEEIAAVSRAAGADVPFLRPAALAQDESTSIDVVRHAIETLRAADEEYDYVMILQPTSPLRTAEDIDGAIKKMLETRADSVMGMVRLSDFSRKKLKTIIDDRIQSLLADEGKTPTHRDDEAVYKRNAAIYLTKTYLLLAGDLFGAVSRPYVMPRERSVDVNEPTDLALAEFFLTRS